MSTVVGSSIGQMGSGGVSASSSYAKATVAMTSAAKKDFMAMQRDFACD